METQQNFRTDYDKEALKNAFRSHRLVAEPYDATRLNS